VSARPFRVSRFEPTVDWRARSSGPALISARLLPLRVRATKVNNPPELLLPFSASGKGDPLIASLLTRHVPTPAFLTLSPAYAPRYLPETSSGNAPGISTLRNLRKTDPRRWCLRTAER